MKMVWPRLALLALVVPVGVRTTVRAQDAQGCGSAAFLTFEQGRLAAVDWTERTGSRVHTRAIVTQSQIIDDTIDLRADETAARSSQIVTDAGDHPAEPHVQDLGDGAIYWNPRIASSFEQAILRARRVNRSPATITGASMSMGHRTPVTVTRIDATDWLLAFQEKTVEVLTTEQGCLLAATFPDYGVTIERRDTFDAAQYPLWAPYDAPPDGAYHATNVAIPAPDGHTIAGTFTMPKEPRGRVPAAVLITGISSHERNNGQPPWMPLRDLSDALTRAGIAVLRADDRGVGKSTGDNATWTIFGKVDDVGTQVGWLRSRADIDPARIALVGYSEGGLIAPMVAAKDRSIAAIVTLAGPGVPGAEVARYQVEQPILRDPAIPEARRPAEIERQLAEALKDLTPHEQTFMSVNPLEYARQVACPALIVHGGSDRTVPRRSAERMANAMRLGGNRAVTVRLFPGISHSLMPDPEGLPSGWATLPAFLTAPVLLDEVVRWTASTLKVRPVGTD